MKFPWKKRKDSQPYAGFVAAPAAAGSEKQTKKSAQNAPPPPADEKTAREMSFLEILAAFYGVNADYFNNSWQPVLERFTLSPDAAQWNQKDDTLPLTVQLMAGTQQSLIVTRESVTVPGLPLDEDGAEAMKAAIEMAILARANPAMAHGVELVGTDEEKAILAAAATIVGLQIKNPPALDNNLKALAEKMAAQIRTETGAAPAPAAKKPDTDKKSAGDSSDHEEPFDSISQALKERLTKLFNDRGTLTGVQAPSEEKIRELWDNLPVEARKDFLEKGLPAEEENIKKEFERRAQAEKDEQEKREELTRALSTPRNVLTDTLPAAIADTLKDGGVKADLYQKVKADILKEPEPEDRRKSRVSFASIKKLLDEKYKLPGDMRGTTKTILNALEQEGVIRMTGSNRRVILAQPNGMLTPAGYDPKAETVKATASAAPALQHS